MIFKVKELFELLNTDDFINIKKEIFNSFLGFFNNLSDKNINQVLCSEIYIKTVETLKNEYLYKGAINYIHRYKRMQERNSITEKIKFGKQSINISPNGDEFTGVVKIEYIFLILQF